MLLVTMWRMGIEPAQIQDPLLDTVGNTGAALPLMILVGALEEAKAGDRILLVSYGNGSDAIVLRVTDEIEKVRDIIKKTGSLNSTSRVSPNQRAYSSTRSAL